MHTRAKHWDTIYQQKLPEQMSWYEPKISASLYWFEKNRIPLTASIIDIGGGDSTLVDDLLRMGFQDITVLDVSEAAIQRAQTRLGPMANRVNWIVADVLEFKPQRHYMVWHDRATFHFLLGREEIDTYTRLACESVVQGGWLVMGTFSEQGPRTCSGLPVKRDAANELISTFSLCFHQPDCIPVEHYTPWGSLQHFTYCCFTRS
jgi:hypothetical protein